MSIKVLTIIFAIAVTVPVTTLTAIPTLAENHTSATASQPSSAAKEAADVTGGKPAVKTKEDLPNFHEVHPFLFRGGEPNEAGLQKLKDMGVATIIDLRAPSEMKINERDSAQKLGMRYINLVMDSHAPTEKQVDEMMKEIDKAKTLSEQGEKNKNIFVHCAHGSDRTGCMIGIWRVTREGYDYPTAYREMRKYYFTPKFTRLSGSVEQYAAKAHPSAGESGASATSKE